MRRFTRVHPSGLPLARNPRMERGPFGFFPGLRTPRSPMTHARAGTIHSTLDRITPSSNRPPIGVTTPHVRLRVARSPSQCPGTWRPVTSAGRVVDVDRLPDPRRGRRAPATLAGLTAGAQADQLPGQGGHRLGVHPLVDRLMRHPARLVGGVLGGQPARDRRRGPARTQLLADHRAQPRRTLHGQQLGPLPPGTRRLVCGRGPIPRTAAMPSDLTEITEESRPSRRPISLYSRDSAKPREISSRSVNINILRTAHPAPPTRQDQMLGPAEPKHYNRQRPHRALQLRPPHPQAPVPEPVHGRIRRRPVLGGLINQYEPAA